ncbi:helix-turn-helix domain-containing protein [Halococcus saccharolyticus]|uniref:Transcription regulator n=1 Tax=Halococcus saccharolyticus DSM 5350 TaxID=1227455 RepID=M0MJY8_9EURY|nr:helix-turn-helix domain-containing protein [Halococcus saccharolyticus]EMA45024.1 transcription regulator [Halococcus saccharolyticus DSM 5350]
MKYLELRLQQSEDVIHPMHEFVAAREEYGSYRLLQWNPAVGETNTMIFAVEGEPEPYAAALETVETALEFEIVPGEGETFYVYVRERLAAEARQLTDAFTHGSLVVMPPLEYRSDRTIDLTVVGSADALQTAIDEAPPGVDAEIRSVGSYDAGTIETASALSDRQAEAATTAVDLGYYETPREATVADVADRLGCAPGTAAEHLRKAEATLVERTVEGLSGDRDV